MPDLALRSLPMPAGTAKPLTSINMEEIATALRIAKDNKAPIEAPSNTWPGLDRDIAFRIMERSCQHSVLERGDRLVGYKLGNIAKVMQAHFGVDEPDYGMLLASTFAYEGTCVKLSDYIAPYVELEPAFYLKAPLRGPNVTVADVINAIDYVLPSIEIIDSRVKNWDIGLSDTLADNGSTGAIILGGTPRRLQDLPSLRDMRGTLQLDGKEVMAGNTGNILGNPINALAWLVNKLAIYGVGIEAGQVVLPGSCLQAVRMDRPGRWTGEYHGFGIVEFDVE